MMLQCYITTSNDGQLLVPQGLMGGQLALWHPGQQQYVERLIPVYAGWLNEAVFGDVMINGVLGRMVDRTPYYAYLYLPADDQTWPRFNFAPVAGPRYAWVEGGPPVYTDPMGNVGTLVGMICPVDGSIASVMGAANARILSSSSPFLNTPQQALSANSGQRGGTFSNTTPQELGWGLGIYACSWAWMESNSSIMGRIAGDAALPTAFIRPFARSLVDGVTHYGPTIIVQFPSPGYNLPLGGHGVSRAFDDGAYYFGIEGWVSHGGAHIQIEHVVHGHI